MDTNPKVDDPNAKLGLWDAISIIVGIIIGVGIFELPHEIFRQVPHPALGISVWVLGGVLAFFGALCFAELASTYPRSGGEYVYLTRAFGPLTGFLFAWAQLTVTRTGSIAALAYIFGATAARVFHWDEKSVFLLAGGSVTVLTIINILGVRTSVHAQNLLTVAKVLGLLSLAFVGLVWGSGTDPLTPIRIAPVQPAEDHWLIGAMILVLWTYSGWHEAAYVVSEAKNHARNIPLALMLGTAIVTVIYLLVNLAILSALGFDGAKQENAAAHVVERIWPTHGANVMNVLIMISALGAINGMIFTTARIYTEFGKDHRLFKVLSHWSKRTKTPARALAAQCVVCIGLIVGVWLARGNSKTFNAAITLTAAVFWMFFCLTGIALMVLRTRDPETPRPFRVPLYPFVPLVFVAWCAYMVVGSVRYDADKSLIGLLILVAGLPFYFIPKKMKHHSNKESANV